MIFEERKRAEGPVFLDRYASPLGEIWMTGEARGLTGLWFADRKSPVLSPETPVSTGKLPVFRQAKVWLDQYFSGQEPTEKVALLLRGTPFQREVWRMLTAIPYGATVTYGALAVQIAEHRGQARMSPQAVGGAVGRNPVALLIPCHRVVGAEGCLTGYAGGLWRKQRLLALEEKAENCRRTGPECPWISSVPPVKSC